MGCTVNQFTFSSPIGKMLVEYCVRGLHFVKQVEFTTDELFSPDKSASVTLLECDTSSDDPVLQKTLHWFQVYFSNVSQTTQLSVPGICVASVDGSFREQVWLALAAHVQAGSTISYGGLAKLIGKPGASRAVGSAMANNPIQIIVPCHRVIKSDGSPGNYAKGCRNEVKKWLLRHEEALG